MMGRCSRKKLLTIKHNNQQFLVNNI